MTNEREGDARADEAARVFAEFLAEAPGAPAKEFRGLVERHPDLEPQLHSLARLRDELERLGIAGVIGSWGWGGRDPELTPTSDSSIRDHINKRLEARSKDMDRYRPTGEVGRGGMGRVLQVWDPDLRRELAMKVLLRDPSEDPDSRRASMRLARFYDEAQITAQLDHPGIVPIHDLGLSSSGELFFTMKLVKGDTLKEIFERSKAGDEQWSRTRVVGMLLKVCEAMAYAHAKGVIHRDLKPGNVMVGRFGEVFVMDWGLARVMNADDKRDLRIRAEEFTRTDDVQSDRRDLVSESPDAPLVTMDGDVVGTPAYMSPEQAAGDLDAMGQASDVYSVGAMLYHLLAGHVPYVTPSARMNNYGVWRCVQNGPPDPLRERAPDVPAELISICEKAMARDASDRYATTEELGGDLRAYLENRVVRAHATGALSELRKWTVRNRGMAAALAGLLVVALGSAIWVARLQSHRAEVERRARDEARAAVLVAQLERSWPIHPDAIPDMQAWLEQSEALLARQGEYERALAELLRRSAGAPRATRELTLSETESDRQLEFLRARLATFKDQLDAWTDPARAEEVAGTDKDGIHERKVLSAEIPRLEHRLEVLERKKAGRRLEVFERSVVGDQHRRMGRMLDHVQRLREGLEVVRARMKDSERLANPSPELAHAWERAIEAIRASEVYADTPAFGPQLGLEPLGANEAGLWEFLLTPSGARPNRSPDGTWNIEPETGVVLVLVPGGTVTVGLQWTNPRKANFVSPGMVGNISPVETPTRTIELQPYFAAKYELTQAQWARLTGSWPSEHFPGASYRGSPRVSSTHPVESVNWHTALSELAQWNLTLPTEAQWERLARAGHSEGVAWVDVGELMGKVNIADASARIHGLAGGNSEDGYAFHSPVDAFPPNPWGFSGVLANVSEWCLDSFTGSHELGRIEGPAGECIPEHATQRAFRGSSFKLHEGFLRWTVRWGRLPHSLDEDLGIRPVRLLELNSDTSDS